MPWIFDGTITKISHFPELGEPNIALIRWLKREQEQGTKLILWTCRVGERLEEAVQFCRAFGLEFDAINENLPEIVEKFGSDCRKVYATKYIDDCSVKPWEIIQKPPKPEKPKRQPRAMKILR